MIPFFIEKIINAFPTIKFTYIDHTKPRKRSDEGYIKPYRSLGEWQPYAGRLRSFELHAPSSEMCKQICARYYQIETLDGSEYYLCQHGVHVK